jgi:hypothetical protein
MDLKQAFHDDGVHGGISASCSIPRRHMNGVATSCLQTHDNKWALMVVRAPNKFMGCPFTSRVYFRAEFVDANVILLVGSHAAPAVEMQGTMLDNEAVGRKSSQGQSPGEQRYLKLYQALGIATKGEAVVTLEHQCRNLARNQHHHRNREQQQQQQQEEQERQYLQWWQQEIERRQQLPEHQGRRPVLDLARVEGEAEIQQQAEAAQVEAGVRTPATLLPGLVSIGMLV